MLINNTFRYDLMFSNLFDCFVDYLISNETTHSLSTLARILMLWFESFTRERWLLRSLYSFQTSSKPELIILGLTSNIVQETWNKFVTS